MHEADRFSLIHRDKDPFVAQTPGTFSAFEHRYKSLAEAFQAHRIAVRHARYAIVVGTKRITLTPSRRD